MTPSPAGCCMSAISPHTSHDLISQAPAPSPCTLCLEWEGNERRSRTHILPAAVSSQISVSGAESFSNPFQEGLLLCWLQIKSFHMGKKTSPALKSAPPVTQRIICSHGKKNTLHRIHLPVTQPNTDSRSQKPVEGAHKAVKHQVGSGIAQNQGHVPRHLLFLTS